MPLRASANLHDEVPGGRGVARVVQRAAAGVVARRGVRAGLQQRPRRARRVRQRRVVQRRPAQERRARVHRRAELVLAPLHRLQRVQSGRRRRCRCARVPLLK